MLRLEALPHFCKALCRGAFSAKRQVRLSLHPLPCVAGPPVLQLSQSSPEGSVEKQFSGWGTWGVREKVYFFAEEEGGLEGWRHSKCNHTAVSGIRHLLLLRQETANCLPKTASSLSIPAGLEQGRPHTSNTAAPPPLRTWLCYYKNPGKSHHHKSIWPPLSGMWKINNQSYQASHGQHWRAKLQRTWWGGEGSGDGGVWNKTKINAWRKNQALPISGNDKQEKRIGENNGGRLLRYPKGL